MPRVQGKDCSRQSFCIPFIHEGHAHERRMSIVVMKLMPRKSEETSLHTPCHFEVTT